MTNNYDIHSSDRENFLSWIEFLEEGVYKDQSPFLKFAILWLSFAGYLSKEYPAEDRDNNRLKAFCADEKNIRIYDDLIKTHDYREKVSRFQNIPSDYEKPRQSVIEVGKSRPRMAIFREVDYEYFKNFIEVIYQIRCNFFHGSKFPSNESDKELVDWASDVFLIYWKKFISQTILDDKLPPKKIQKSITSQIIS